MTREECKEVLQALWRYKDCGYSENEIRESLDMAIKLLEQETVLDQITTEIQRLRGCSCSCSDGIIDDVEDIIDKYRESEEEE